MALSSHSGCVAVPVASRRSVSVELSEGCMEQRPSGLQLVYECPSPVPGPRRTLGSRLQLTTIPEKGGARPVVGLAASYARRDVPIRLADRTPVRRVVENPATIADGPTPAGPLHSVSRLCSAGGQSPTTTPRNAHPRQCSQAADVPASPIAEAEQSDPFVLCLADGSGARPVRTAPVLATPDTRFRTVDSAGPELTASTSGTATPVACDSDRSLGMISVSTAGEDVQAEASPTSRRRAASEVPCPSFTPRPRAHTVSESARVPTSARGASQLRAKVSRRKKVDEPRTNANVSDSASVGSGKCHGKGSPRPLPHSSPRKQSASPSRIRWLLRGDSKGTLASDQMCQRLRDQLGVHEVEPVAPEVMLRKFAHQHGRTSGATCTEEVSPEEEDALRNLFGPELQNEIVRCRRVQNPVLWRNYQRAAAKGPARDREMVLFHGTRGSAVKAIVQEGLDPARGALSPGVWVGPSASYSIRYARRHSDAVYAVFAALVCPDVTRGDSERSKNVWRLASKASSVPIYVVLCADPTLTGVV
mmetsp:Transcript_60719/g.162906  ORF Transcript_60719/g.162906 Transcript_60719/m.162906 type:complete len:533 (+) Transcript_60719:23-1621(+)